MNILFLLFNIFSTMSTFACHIKQINPDKYILKSLSTLKKIFDANNNALCGWIDFFEGYTKVYETVYLKVRYIQGDQKKLSKLLCLEI